MKLTLDMIDVLKKPGVIDSLNVKTNFTEKNFVATQNDYNKFVGSSCCQKLSHPCWSPCHIMVFFLYIMMMAVFAISVSLPTITDSASTDQGIALSVSDVVLLVLAIAANLYALAVALMWIAMVVIVLLIIAAILALIALIIYGLITHPEKNTNKTLKRSFRSFALVLS